MYSISIDCGVNSETDAFDKIKEEILPEDFQDRINTLPIVFKGNTSKLNGFKESMIRNFPSNDLYFIKGDTVGASFDEYGSLLGAIYLNKDLNDNNINRNSTNINSSLKRMEGDYNE